MTSAVDPQAVMSGASAMTKPTIKAIRAKKANTTASTANNTMLFASLAANAARDF